MCHEATQEPFHKAKTNWQQLVWSPRVQHCCSLSHCNKATCDFQHRDTARRTQSITCAFATVPAVAWKEIGTQQGTSSSKNSNPNGYSTILWHTLLSVAVRAIDMRIHDLTCLDCRSKNWTQIVASTSAPAACGAADALCRRAGCLDRPQPKPPVTT